jgi:hypothetical protein
LAAEKGERGKINLTPQSLSEFRPKSFKEHYDDKQDDGFWDSGDEKETQADKNDGDSWNTEKPAKKGKAKTEEDDFDDF